MADFCNKCALEMFGDEVQPDINVYEIYESLPEGHAEFGHLCEGCGIVAIAKTDDGKLAVLRHMDIQSEDWESY